MLTSLVLGSKRLLTSPDETLPQKSAARLDRTSDEERLRRQPWHSDDEMMSYPDDLKSFRLKSNELAILAKVLYTNFLGSTSTRVLTPRSLNTHSKLILGIQDNPTGRLELIGGTATLHEMGMRASTGSRAIAAPYGNPWIGVLDMRNSIPFYSSHI